MIEHLYNGLTQASKTLVDTSANWSLFKKSFNEDNKILETIVTNNCHWGDDEVEPARKLESVMQLDVISELKAQMATMNHSSSEMRVQMTNMNNMLKTLILGNQAPVTPINEISSPTCVYCCKEHLFDDCPYNPTFMCYIG